MKLIFTSLLLINIIVAEKLISPNQDVYVLVTVLNTTTFEELQELIYFYLDIQSSCLSCNPQILNFPCLAFFGQFKENFTTSTNTTADIQALINSTYFAQNIFNQTLAVQGSLDIEWQLGFVYESIQLTQQNPEGRIRKKQIAILSNYFYPYMAGDLGGVIMNDMNVTFVSLFALNGSFIPMEDIQKSEIPIRVFDKSSPGFNYTEASELYLNQYIGKS